MAWDVERTKRLLLDAATAEFSEHGLAGARIDRIAANAGVNKERIYQYFGKKHELFAVVLSAQLRSTMDAVPMKGEGPAAAGDYAGRLFDHHVAEATIPRLVFGEGLERGESAAADAARAEYHRAKVDGFQRLLPGLDRPQAAELLLTIVTLVNGGPALGAARVDRADGRTARRGGAGHGSPRSGRSSGITLIRGIRRRSYCE